MDHGAVLGQAQRTAKSRSEEKDSGEDKYHHMAKFEDNYYVAIDMAKIWWLSQLPEDTVRPLPHVTSCSQHSACLKEVCGRF